MSSPAFGDYVFTTLSRARNSADGSPLSLQQKSDVAAYLRSSGSEPDAVTSIEVYLSKAVQSSPAELPVGTEYPVLSWLPC